MALVWLAAAFLAGRYIAVLPFGFVVFCVFVFAVPIAISGIYSSAVNQTRMMSYYKTSGWFYKFFSGSIIRSVLWVIWALISSFAMVIQFSTYASLEWLTLGISIPVFWYVHKLCNKILSSELKKRYVISSFAITWTRLLCPLLLVVVYAVLVSAFVKGYNNMSLAEAVASTRANTPEVAGSSVVKIALLFVSFIDGSKKYLGSSLSLFGEYVPLLLIVLGSYMVYFNASATFASFAIPRAELRRIFGPISDEEIPPSLTGKRVAIATAIVTVVTLFIYVPIFADIEDHARLNPSFIASIKNSQAAVEKIDNEFYRPGTKIAIELEQYSALGKVNASKVVLERQIDLAFSQLESNVDDYLDWYYSLSGEYTRLAKLATGEVEKYMEEKLVEMLKQDAAFKPVLSGIEVALANHVAVTAEYQQKVKQILANNKIQVPEFGAKRVASISSESLLVLPTHFDVISMKSRGVGGVAAAGIATAITAKVVSKGVFKVAGKALSKVAISKVGGTMGGAAIGAAAGSFVPFVGTAVGFVGGLAVGFAADYFLLRLESAISREDFKNEILGAIHESQDAFKSKLFGAS